MNGKLPVVIDIRRFAPHIGNQAGVPLFYAAFVRHIAYDNAEWARRKGNIWSPRLHRSSYAIELGLKQKNTTLQERSGPP